MGEFGEITILNQHSDRQTKLKVFKKDTITTGGTRPIDIVEANVVHGTQERSAGKYVIKHEYYSGEIEEKMERYDACKKAGLPVPSTFRKGVTTKKENVL
ncbi:hypothetical protein ISS86_03150, partial [Candidatus Microgenomates bacterium]|nr:hypothetical protein [Candidatus Microgenomates bacterium]